MRWHIVVLSVARLVEEIAHRVQSLRQATVRLQHELQRSFVVLILSAVLVVVVNFFVMGAFVVLVVVIGGGGGGGVV